MQTEWSIIAERRRPQEISHLNHHKIEISCFSNLLQEPGPTPIMKSAWWACQLVAEFEREKIVTFEGGKFTDKIRKCCISSLSHIPGVNNVMSW